MIVLRWFIKRWLAKIIVDEVVKGAQKGAAMTTTKIDDKGVEWLKLHRLELEKVIKNL